MFTIIPVDCLTLVENGKPCQHVSNMMMSLDCVSAHAVQAKHSGANNKNGDGDKK